MVKLTKKDGIHSGKWNIEVKDLFERHEIDIVFSQRGFASKWTGVRKKSTIPQKINTIFNYFIVACKSLDVGILSHIRWYRMLFKYHNAAIK